MTVHYETHMIVLSATTLCWYALAAAHLALAIFV
jgi:hypothetical protein